MQNRDAELLTLVHKNAEMGRDGINHLISRTGDLNFRQALETQLCEYQRVLDSSEKMLQERHEAVQGVGCMAKTCSYLMANMKITQDPSTENLARMMVRGSAMGVSKLLEHLREYESHDERVLDLSKKLLLTERNNLREMKKYL